MDTTNGSRVWSLVSHCEVQGADKYISSMIRANGKSPEHGLMEKLLSDLQGNSLSFAFRQPVSAEDVPDYYEVIKSPMGAFIPHFLYRNSADK